MKNKFKFVLSILMVLTLLLGMMPLSVFAIRNPIAYPDSVWVGDVEMAKNTYLASGASATTDTQPSNDGFAYYSSDGVLTLNNFSYSGEGTTFDISYKSVIYVEGSGSIKIDLVGENSLTNTDDASVCDPYAIYVKDGTLTIMGEGSLSINATNAIYLENGCIGIESGDLNVSASWGITADDFYLSGGTVQITTTKYGIKVDDTGSVDVTGGELTVSNASTQYPAINQAPYLGDYNGAYEITVSQSANGSNPETYDEAKYASYKYYEIKKGSEVYGIVVSDPSKSDPSDPGVRITSANCTDVLGDGTVSYDPENNKLTLNNYVYDGAGAQFGVCAGIMFSGDEEWYDIELKGSNSIKVNGAVSAGIGAVDGCYITLVGDGSLYVEAVTYGIITGEGSDGGLYVEGGDITVKTTGNPSAAVMAGAGVVIEGGSMKLESALLGIMVANETGYVALDGGSLEISVASAGYTIVCSGESAMDFNPFVPYVWADGDAYHPVASANSDGSEAVAYNPDDLASYKYVKFERDLTYAEYDIIISDPENEDPWPDGVLITSKNCADVLGDGTVSYDPETRTLTLNNYVYEGRSLRYSRSLCGIHFYGKDVSGYTLMLKGNNSIKLTNTENSTGFSFDYASEAPLTVIGDGSLMIETNYCGISVPALEIKSGNVSIKSEYGVGTGSFVMNGGSLTIEATDCAFEAGSFEMNGGSVEIDADYGIILDESFLLNSGSLKIDVEWVGVYSDTGVAKITGGTLEIGTEEAGTLFVGWNEDEDEELPMSPDLSEYKGIYVATASINKDGSESVTYTPDNIATYKYLKIAHTHEFGAEWKSDADNHWNECVCGGKSNVGAHTDGNGDSKCDTCEYAMPVSDGSGNGGSDNGGLGAGAIIGIVIGSVLVVGIGGFAIFWFVIKKRTFAELVAVFKK